MTTPAYRGRFAPSPTGPLHFGSLVAALASCLEARAQGGEWYLRMEDVDAPRCSPSTADDILRTLERFGFAWDGPVLWQSRRREAYGQALALLITRGAVFPCACTRRELADSRFSEIAADGAAIYPGTCRQGLPPGKSARSWRLRVGEARITFADALLGCISSELAREVGDFVLRRADGVFAYQLAVVVDDADCGMTHVLRGADLLHSTARQIFLQQCLGLPTPAYAHVPVAVNAAGEKLSKQTGALPLDAAHPGHDLVAALRFLGQMPPPDLALESVATIWAWACAHWSLTAVPRSLTRPYNDCAISTQDTANESAQRD